MGTKLTTVSVRSIPKQASTWTRQRRCCINQKGRFLPSGKEAAERVLLQWAAQ